MKDIVKRISEHLLIMHADFLMPEAQQPIITGQ